MKHSIQTQHSNIRANQRGISKKMIAFTLNHGKIIGDKFVTNKKIISDYLLNLDKKIAKFRRLRKQFKQFKVSKLINNHVRKLQKVRKLALKIMDKGGVTVVYEGCAIITAYNTNSYLKY